MCTLFLPPAKMIKYHFLLRGQEKYLIAPMAKVLITLLYNALLKIILFIFGCAGSSLLPGLFSSCCEWGLLSSCGAWASYGCGFSCCRARLQGMWASAVAAHGLSSGGSWTLEHRLNICGTRLILLLACGLFLDQGSNPCLLHWQADSTTEPPGKPCTMSFLC